MDPHNCFIFYVLFYDWVSGREKKERKTGAMNNLGIFFTKNK